MLNIYFVVVINILSQICSNLTFKIITNQYGIQAAFFENIVMAIINAILGIFILAPMYYCERNYPESEWTIKSEYRKWNNHKVYCLTGLIDAITSFGMAISGPSISGDFQVILQQLAFPLTVILAPIFFKSVRENIILCIIFRTKVFIWYIFGIFMLLSGVVVSVNDIYANDLNQTIIFTISSCLSCSSWLFKQYILDSKKCTLMQINVINSIYMVLFLILLWPIQLTKLFGDIPIDQFFNITFVNGEKCFFGEYDGCDNFSWLYELLYSFAIFVTQLCTMFLCQQKSAAYQRAVQILVIPFSCIIFTITNLPTNSTQPMTFRIFIGLVLIVKITLLMKIRTSVLEEKLDLLIHWFE